MRTLALLVLLATTAHAQPSTVEPTPPPAATVPGEDAYRIETVVVDASALALAIISFNSPDLLGIATLTYLLGPPVVHGLHGHGWRAGASVALRVGLPVALGLVGIALDRPCKPPSPYDECGDDEGPSDGLALGVGGGILAAMIIDTAYLARGTPAQPARSITPTASTTRGGLTVGISGSF